MAKVMTICELWLKLADGFAYGFGFGSSADASKKAACTHAYQNVVPSVEAAVRQVNWCPDSCPVKIYRIDQIGQSTVLFTFGFWRGSYFSLAQVPWTASVKCTSSKPPT